MSLFWGENGINELALLRRDFERSNAMHASNPAPTKPAANPWAGFNTWEDKNAADWWAVAQAAAGRGDTVARDEAISVARSLAEADAITQRFEGLPIIQRYRAALAREQEPTGA